LSYPFTSKLIKSESNPFSGGCHMQALTRMVTILSVLVLIAIPQSELSNTASGDLVPDYFLELEDTVVHLAQENNYLDDFSLFVHNTCIHSLRIRVSISASGLSVSPQSSTITVAPYSSHTIPVAVATTFGSPHSVNLIDIDSQVTHANGLPVSIKERAASVVAYIHRYQDVSAEADSVEVAKGEAETFEVMVTNQGNSVDYYTMWFYENDWIFGTASTDVIEVGPGETVGYPAVVHISRDVPDPPEDLEYRIQSLVNRSLTVDGVVPLEITEGGGSRNSISMAMSSGILLTGLILLLIAMWYFELFSTRSGAITSRSKTIQTPLLRSFRTISISCFLIMGVFLVPLAENTQGQITPEIDVVTGSGIYLDVSPLTDDFSHGITTVTISSTTSVDICVKVTIDAPGFIFGYVNEHLVPPMSSTTFFVGTAALKGSAYRQTAANVFVEVIEVAGIPFTGTSEAQAGFFLLRSPYSLPMVTSETGYVQVEKNKPVNVEISVRNGGNAVDEFEFWTLNRHSLQHHGINLSADPEPITLDPSDSRTVSILIEQVEDVEDEGFILDFRATSGIDDERSECTILIVPKEVIQEEENDPPEAKIESISPNPATEGDTITLEGSGTDDGEVVRYQWISSYDGELYDGQDTVTTVTGLTPGDHTISLWVMDDEGAWSDEVTTTLTVEESVSPESKPVVTFSWPHEGENVSGQILIEGTASVDGGEIEKVEISLGGGPWMKVAGTESWRFVWDTIYVPDGPCFLTVRSFDGDRYSDNATVNITIWNEAGMDGDGDSDDDFIPVISWMGLIGGIGFAGILRKRKRTRGTI